MSTERAPARNARTAVVLDGEWNMGIPLKVPMAVTGGGLLCTRGQIDVDAGARVLHPGDPLVQTRACLRHIARVLEAKGLSPGAVLQVNHYYRAGADPVALEAEIRNRLGAAVPVAMIPVPHFYYAGIETETDIVALAAGTAGTRRREVIGGHLAMARGPLGTFFAGRIAGADRVAACDPLAEVARLLGETGAPGRLWLHLQAPDIGTYRGLRERLPAETGGWEVALVPCLTPAVPDIALTLSGFACPGGLRRSGAPAGGVAVLRGAGLAFVDLALPAPDPADARAEHRPVLAAQAGRVMAAIGAALAGHGLGFGDVLKATTYYVGDDSAEDLYANLRVRDGFYGSPGPASTGVPFLALDRGEARITVSLMLAAPGWGG